jgi:hypothetical protein
MTLHLALAFSVIDNASPTPATADEVRQILQTGTGIPSHVQALFGDMPAVGLMDLRLEMGISEAVFEAARHNARRLHGAANPDFDGFEFAG